MENSKCRVLLIAILITVLSISSNQLSAKVIRSISLITSYTTDTVWKYTGIRDSVTYYTGGEDTVFYMVHVDGYLVKWQSYYSKNRIHNVVNFERGLIHGDFKQYFKNGKLYRETCFKNGKILCGMRVYDKKGRIKYLYLTRPKKRDKFYSRTKYNRFGEEVKSKDVEVYPPTYGFFPDYHQSGSLTSKSEG